MSEWKNSEQLNSAAVPADNAEAASAFDVEACVDAVRKPPRSRIRKIYLGRLVARCFIFVGCVLLVFFWPKQFEILHGWNFFKRIYLLHVLWGLWVFDMLLQLIPVGTRLALGSQKLFKMRFRPIKEAIDHINLRKYIIETTKAAYKVFLIWAAAIVVLVVLRETEVINDAVLFLITAAFYVCDLICVLIWCPFRLIMHNRCCTTCRIFNWDHLMMFTPMLAMRGFFSQSLILMAFVVWLVWELCVMVFPERFWEHSNEALSCANCTDKLCTQYCQKLRKPNNLPI